MGWISWAVGLAFFDVMIIILVTAFGLSGMTDVTTEYNTTITEMDSAQTVDFEDLNWFDKFELTYSNVFPWWFNLLAVTLFGLINAIVIIALVRGVN